MKFKKINEHAIECFISASDLDELGISLEDFIKDTEKTNEFVHRIVNMSRAEVDFNPRNNLLQAQIMPYDGGILMYVFDMPAEKIGEMLAKRIKQELLKRLSGGGDSGADELDKLLEGINTEEQDSEIFSPIAPGDVKCYMFPTFEHLMDFIKKCRDDIKVRSQLYYQDNTYFLVFSVDGGDDDGLNYLCRFAEEFGYLSADCDSRILLIKEHTKPLISRDAVNVLKNSL